MSVKKIEVESLYKDSIELLLNFKFYKIDNIY